METDSKRKELDAIFREIDRLKAQAVGINLEIAEAEKAESRKAELIQQDLNLASDINAAENEIEDHKKAIQALECRISGLEAKREAVHREWCEKFAAQANAGQEPPKCHRLTLVDAFRAYCFIDPSVTCLSPYDELQLKKFRCLIRGERHSSSFYGSSPVTADQVERDLRADGYGDLAELVREARA